MISTEILIQGSPGSIGRECSFPMFKVAIKATTDSWGLSSKLAQIVMPVCGQLVFSFPGVWTIAGIELPLGLSLTVYVSVSLPFWYLHGLATLSSQNTRTALQS